MLANVWKLLVLIAVLVMPFGMQPVAASPVASHGAPAAASMPMQHCPEQGSRHAPKASLGECTMACSAALPAAERAADPGPQSACAPIDHALAQALHGLQPETATPPPKHS